MDNHDLSVFHIEEKASRYGMSTQAYKNMLIRSLCVPEVPEFPDDCTKEDDANY